MATIDPTLDFRDQVKKIEFARLAENSRNLAANFRSMSAQTNNFISQMVLNSKAMAAQQKSITQQVIADNADLRLKKQRTRLLQDEMNSIKRDIESKRAAAQAEVNRILTTGKDSMGRFAGAAQIDSILSQANSEIDNLTKQYNDAAGTQRSLIAESEGLEQQISFSNKTLKDLKWQKLGTALDIFAKAMKTFSDAMLALLNYIYKIQQDVGLQIGAATDLALKAQLSVIRSYLPGSDFKNILNPQEIIDATTNFKKEFGTILSAGEAARIADEAKSLGVSSSEYIRAKRAFLGSGADENRVRLTAINEFKKQGLAASDAIQFAAQNANLLAVAGGKYADSLFRAAAEAKKIGVNLGDIEKFANSVVGDFEGALESFAEVSALGFDMDFNRIMEVSATGTTEELQNLLREQFSMSGITGEELQRNRQLRLSLTQTTGFDESTLLRLAGVAQQPKEQTIEEKQVTILSNILTELTKVTKVFAVILGAAAGGFAGFKAGAALAPFLGPLAPIAPVVGAGLGIITGGFTAAGMASGGLVRGPGTSTSDSIPRMLSDGEYVLNANAVKRVGLDALNAVNYSDVSVLNTTQPAKMQAGVKLDQIPGMKDGGFVKKSKTDSKKDPAKEPKQFTLSGKTYSRINEDIPTWAEKALITSISAAANIASVFMKSPKVQIFKEAVLDRRTEPFTEKDFSSPMLDSLAMFYAALPKPKKIESYTAYSNAKQQLANYPDIVKNIYEWEMIIGRANVSKTKGGVRFKDTYDFNDYESSKWLSSKGRSKEDGLLTKWGLDVAANREIGLSNVMAWLGRRALPDGIRSVPVNVMLDSQRIKDANKQFKSISLPKKHDGGLIAGSGESPMMLQSGEYVVNPKATSTYGTEFLDKINSGTYAQSQPVVNNTVTVNTDSLKEELRQIVGTLRNMKVEMNGYEVGHVAFNEARTPLKAR